MGNSSLSLLQTGNSFRDLKARESIDVGAGVIIGILYEALVMKAESAEAGPVIAVATPPSPTDAELDFEGIPTRTSNKVNTPGAARAAPRGYARPPCASSPFPSVCP